MKCRHCNARVVRRPRGLCWGCYYTPGVKELYPTDPKHGKRAADDTVNPADPPSGPTAARQGTAEKIEELARRAARREGLFHPGDGPRDE